VGRASSEDTRPEIPAEDKPLFEALRQLRSLRPDTPEVLGEINGVGANKLERYGEAVLEIIEENT